MWSNFLNLSCVFLTVIIAGLQMIPQDWSGLFWKTLRDHSFYIVIFFGVLVIFIHCLDYFFKSSHVQKVWLQTFLRHIVDEHLCGELYHTRISILRKQKGYIVFFKSLWYYVFCNFINNFKHSSWKASIKSIAVHFFSDYLIVYARYSSPRCVSGCTYFRLSDRGSRERFNGIADKCFQEGIAINVNTVDISCLQPLPYRLETLGEKNRKKVKKYMSDCCFHESFYDSVRRMNQISCNLYAVPVTLVDQTIWGVVIVDSDQNSPRNYEELLKDFMASYMKIINFTISSLK